MIQDKTILAVIPARGGSKGLPHKNILPLGGRPLLAWTVTAARSSRLLDRFVLSSEDQEIIAVARSLGCEVPFVRPRELADDDTPGILPVLHALRVLPEHYDYVVLLQPTSPLRGAADIDACIERCHTMGAPACVSVTPATKSPYWYHRLDERGRLRPLLDGPGASRRQDLPESFLLNGAVYVARARWLQESKTFLTDETVGWVMPRERSLDIDSREDLAQCELLLSQVPVSPAG